MTHGMNLSEHPDREDMRATFLARLEYGVDLAVHQRGPRMTDEEEWNADINARPERGPVLRAGSEGLRG